MSVASPATAVTLLLIPATVVTSLFMPATVETLELIPARVFILAIDKLSSTVIEMTSPLAVVVFKGLAPPVRLVYSPLTVAVMEH